ncbi:hypothetical protein AVEN_161407-1 [Araneus ventricosus]|uniref:Uncharacterized protein n=1 Tax=Araneus ventricosus TaxID=182803 RepID=A0A4Y2C158_ARAVE|nr:hypothetical protein AVEN_161407-1 [Araneus ventricosus]
MQADHFLLDKNTVRVEKNPGCNPGVDFSFRQLILDCPSLRRVYPRAEKNCSTTVSILLGIFFNFFKIDTEDIPCDTTITLSDDTCRKFRPYPRDMRGRIKDRLSEYVGFYDSVESTLTRM